MYTLLSPFDMNRMKIFNLVQNEGRKNCEKRSGGSSVNDNLSINKVFETST